jgi:hypothetical protein
MPNARYVGMWHGGVNYTHGYAEDAESFTSIRDAAETMRERRNRGYWQSQTFRYVFREREDALTPCAHDDNSGYVDLFRVGPEDGPEDIRNAIYSGCPDYRIEFGPRGGIRIERG